MTVLFVNLHIMWKQLNLCPVLLIFANKICSIQLILRKSTHCPNLDLIQFDVPYVGQNIDATVHIGP